jgi:hypothetical protein
MRLGGSLKLRIFVLRVVNRLCVQESGTDVLRVNFEDTSTSWRPRRYLLVLVEVALEPARREYLYDPDGPALHRVWGTLCGLST